MDDAMEAAQYTVRFCVNSTFFVARVPSSCKVFERAVPSEVLRRDITTDKMSQFVLIYGMFILNGCEDCTIQRRRKRFTDIRRLFVDRGRANTFVQYTLVILREFNGRTIRYSKLLARHNALFDGCGFFENGRVADALQLTAGSREIRIDLVYRFVFPAMKSAWVSVSMTIDAIFKASCGGPLGQASNLVLATSTRVVPSWLVPFMDCFSR